jgi:hypothetical protein
MRVSGFLLASALVPAMLTLGTPAPATAGSPWCKSARKQVVEWSVQQKDRGRPYVTKIRRSRVVLDRVIEAPADGVVLRCRGRATLSNGLHARVTYGFQSFDGTWYLFLHRGR